MPTVFDFKQGWKTTEFWVGLIPVVVMVLAVFGVNINPADVSNVVYAAAALVSAAYVLGRSFLKAFRVHAVANVHAAELAAKVQLGAVSSVQKNV